MKEIENKSYLYLLPFKDKKHFKIGISSNNLNRIDKHNNTYGLIKEDCIIVTCEEDRHIKVLEKDLLSIFSENISDFSGLDGHTEIRSIENLKKSLDYIEHKSSYINFVVNKLPLKRKINKIPKKLKIEDKEDNDFYLICKLQDFYLFLNRFYDKYSVNAKLFYKDIEFDFSDTPSEEVNNMREYMKTENYNLCLSKGNSRISVSMGVTSMSFSGKNILSVGITLPLDILKEFISTEEGIFIINKLEIIYNKIKLNEEIHIN